MSNTLTGKYKESGSSWIGMIPEMWGTCLIKNIFSIQKRIAGEEGHTVLSITQRGIVPKKMSEQGQFAQDYSHYQLVFPGDFAMNHMDLLTGWVDISKYEGVTSPDYRVFVNERPNIAYSDYFKYIFQYCYSNRIFYGLGQGVSGFGRWRLPSDMFLNFRLPLPPFAEQKTIAEFLGQKTAEIDTIITEARASIEEYKSWKASIIYEAVTRGLDPNVEMKESGVEWIGKIPQHWDISRIKRCAQFMPKIDFSHIANSDMITFTPMECIKNGYFENRKKLYAEIEGSYTPYAEGDIVLAKVTPCFENGNCSIMTDLASNVGLGSSELFVLRAKHINSRYLFYFIRNIGFIQAGKATMTGTGGLKRVSSDFVNNCVIPIPSEFEQQQIVDYLDTKCIQIDSIIEEKEKLILDLEMYKKSLIYEVVTGKRKVI